MGLTGDDLRRLAARAGFEIGPSVPEDRLELSARGSSGPLRIKAGLEEDGRLVRLSTADYLFGPTDGRGHEEILRLLEALNPQLAGLRLVMDPKTGEIVARSEAGVPDGPAVLELLLSVLRSFLESIDRLRVELVKFAAKRGLDLVLPDAGPAGDDGARRWLAALGRARGHTKRFAATPYTPDAVDCAVFSQSEARAGDSVLVQVFAFVPGYEGEAQSLAREFDEEARKLGGVSLATEILRGAALTFELSVRGTSVPDAVQSLIWRGKTQSVQFEVPIPPDGGSKNLIGRVLVSQDTIPIGQVLFKIRVLDGDAAADTASRPTGDAHRYRTAFISYASKDRAEVLRRVQMLRTVGIGYFQDVFDLEPGDDWAQKLYQLIDQSDVLFLFWSSAARESEWVGREWRYGLEKKGEAFIHPVIIEGPPAPAPPPELAHLHFADPMLYFINAGR